MEKSVDVFLGYKEFRTEHYNKWEKSQSTRYFEYRKKFSFGKVSTSFRYCNYKCL